MQTPQIIELSPKLLVGLHTQMSLSEGKIPQLWQQFMSRKKEIQHAMGSDLYSVQVYPKGLNMATFTPETKFEKWAAVEVIKAEDMPEGMSTLSLPAGLYAVFLHKGPVSAFHQTAQYIFGQWLPQSGYTLDDRPHFEILGEKYLGPSNPESEEEAWIPIK